MIFVTSINCTETLTLHYGCSYHTKSLQKWFTTSRSNSFGFLYLGDVKVIVIVVTRQIKIGIVDGGVQMLDDVIYILELRNSLFFLGTLKVNGFSYKDDEIMKFINCQLILMRKNKNAYNFYKLLRSIIVDDDVLISWV